MTPHVRPPLLALLMLTTPLAACAQQADAPAPVASAAPAVAQSAAPQLVTGLPDFTQLVEQVGPGVVNVEATVGSRRSAQADEEVEIPEIFRRMLPPGFQMPGPGQQSPQRRGTSMGSGFIISADGYVLTNHHVVDGADEVKVTLPDRRELTAKVVGSDQQYDVALLKVDAKGLPTVRIGNSTTLKPGQWVVAIGSPLGLDHSVTAGIVSAVGRSASPEQRYVPFIQTDVAINQGNSGGPLLNTRGEVVGINSQIFSVSGGYMGISFAIPIDLAMGAVEQLKTTGKVSRGQLGVQVGALDTAKAKGLKAPDTRGALVSEVLPNTGAQKAGLGPGDIILAVNGLPVNDSRDLPPIVGALAPGTEVKLGLLREGKRVDVLVTLGELDEGDEYTPSPSSSTNQQPLPDSGNSLGVVTRALTESDRSQLGLDTSAGVMISRVDSKEAREAGLVPGMIILQVGRTKVDSPTALDRQLAALQKDDTVMLLVRHRGVTRFLAISPESN
nr:DegQ family serine endoprotease [uncultured Pseudoxanthomonas sp.]